MYFQIKYPKDFVLKQNNLRNLYSIVNLSYCSKVGNQFLKYFIDNAGPSVKENVSGEILF